MANVKVNDIPVRYENETYPPGAEFEMKDEHINERLVTVVEKKTEKKAPAKK
ncbi:hypothetical protein [Sporosarcina trichiuri]|uniref:hypothetical protein n=1 Tax=Sporosarcina trichiuri TaxID=3056445 RepID=UPI0025B5B02F|nr:hypothetical protein [Sporosarcina sp. 0.2-SM1T-5]WJY27470.1 hypothetical protein QWT68_00165 [Sporosarcina sp. 0.2-SM1T-5]